MEFLETWFISIVRDHYFEFEGRTSRKAFWMYVLVYFILAVIVAVIEGALNTSVLSFLLGLALLLPSLSIGARRLHDTGLSGWWQLLGLIPLVGFIIMIVLFVRAGEVGANKYGAPTGEAAATQNTDANEEPSPMQQSDTQQTHAQTPMSAESSDERPGSESSHA